MQLLPGTNHGTNCLNTCYPQVLLHSGVDGVTSLAGNTPLVESRPDALGMGLTRNELKKKGGSGTPIQSKPMTQRTVASAAFCLVLLSWAECASSKVPHH